MTELKIKLHISRFMDEPKITKALVDSDLDGVVCAALLKIIFPNITVRLTEASALQSGRDLDFIDEHCVIADLSYIEGCGLYYDHHLSNDPGNKKIPGVWKPYNSAAEVIYEQYKDKYDLQRFWDLIVELGRFDTGLTTIAELREMNDYLLLAFAVERQDKEFSAKLIDILSKNNWEQVLEMPLVKMRLQSTRENINLYYDYLKKNTRIEADIAVIDNSRFQGNMVHAFFIAAIYPEVNAIIMIKQVQEEKRLTMFWNNFNTTGIKYDLLAVAHELNPKHSGGHKGACGVTLPASLSSEAAIIKIKELLAIQSN